MHGAAEKLHIGRGEKLLGRPLTAWYGPPTLPTKAATNLHIVVSCADRKSASAGEPVRLRSIAAGSLEERCVAWWRLLMGAPASTPARDLYAGDHWSVANGLPALAGARGFSPSLWIASAGYGVIPAEARVAAYSATFSSESRDGVAAGAADPRAASQHWWRYLGDRRFRGLDAPRTLRGVAERAGRGAVMMVIASPPYLAAMERDLLAVLEAAPRLRLLLVTSSPGPTEDSLREHWIPTTAPLRTPLGGALTSLNARVARRLIDKVSPNALDVEAARRHVTRLTERAPDLPAPERDRSDDASLRAFIRDALGADPNACHTPLLRKLRASGRACEQSRFRKLFVLERRAR